MGKDSDDDSDEEEGDEDSDNDTIFQSQKSGMPGETFPSFSELQAQNFSLLEKLKLKLREISFLRNMIKAGKFPNVIRRGGEFSLEHFNEQSIRLDKLEMENLQLKRMLEKKERGEIERNSILKELEVEYNSLKNELFLVSEKKEREELAFQNLRHVMTQDEEGVISLLMHKVGELNQQIKTLQKKNREILQKELEIGNLIYIP